MPFSSTGMDKSKKREYCEILGVPEEADEEAVKRAYKRLVLEHHPDRPGNKGREQEAAHIFNKINEAYEQLTSTNNTLNVLKSIFKSQEIHTSLEHFFFTSGKSFVFNPNMQQAGSREFKQTSQDFKSSSKEFNINNPNNSTGSNGRTSFTTMPTMPTLPTKIVTPKAGQSLQTTLKIGFFESITGCVKTIEYNRNKICTHCAGHGTFTTRIECRDCNGKGMIQRSESTGNTLIIPCSSCYSQGFIQTTTENCNSCMGSGRTVSKKTSTITVPHGVFSGMKKVYEGEGDEGENGGVDGDLIIYFDVATHPYFQRPNQSSEDVFCRVTIPFPHAVLGTKLEVPSMYGRKVHVDVEAGTQHEQIIRVRDEGFYSISKQRHGDMYIQICVEVPKVLDEMEKKLLKKLALGPHFQSMFVNNINNNNSNNHGNEKSQSVKSEQ